MIYVYFPLIDHTVLQAVVWAGNIKNKITNKRYFYTFAACSTGFYGNNCSEQCNNNCNETTKCNRFTGKCGGGCKSGWTGNTCDDGNVMA